MWGCVGLCSARDDDARGTRLLSLAGGQPRGEIEIHACWKFDRKYSRSMASLLGGMGKLLSFGGKSKKKAGGDDDDDEKPSIKQNKSQPKKEKVNEKDEWMVDDDDARPKLSAKEQEALEEMRAARSGMAHRLVEDLKEEAVLKRGAYQFQLHAVEARDLRAKDVTGMSDPYVKVTVLGKVQKTRIIMQVTNCVFDETLFFNFDDLTAAEAREAVVQIDVYDYDTIGSHYLIGSL